MTAFSRGIGLGLGILGLVAAASAQESLDKGKTPEQLYTANCAICHKSPRGLAGAGGILGVENFLRDHYTTSKEAAAAIAGYLKSVDQSAPPVRPRGAKPATADTDKSSGKDKPADKKSVKREPKPADIKVDESKTGKKDDKKKADQKDAGKRKKLGEAKLPKSKPLEGMENKAGDADKPQPKSDEPKPSEAKPAEAKPPVPKASESKSDAPAKDSK